MSQAGDRSSDQGQDERKDVKCLVWDLDDTLWEGILLEGDSLRLREGAVQVIWALDRRGILHSIASRNDPEKAIEQLRRFGLEEYFLYPQIGWGSKPDSIQRIAGALNLSLDALAFVDDQPFERDQVRFSLPQVRCYAAADLLALPELPEMRPRFVTEDSRQRRLLYRTDLTRQQAEEEFAGPQEDFLSTLGMRMTIFPAGETDLLRAEELTVRTNQLNTTGRTYSFEQLDRLRRSSDHALLMARLEDRYGPYGTIGLALVAKEPGVWTVKLLLMSCRVMARGVGTVLLYHLMRQAKGADARLRAEFLPNPRNRMMEVTLRFAGFEQVGQVGEVLVLENDLEELPSFPGYVELRTAQA